MEMLSKRLVFVVVRKSFQFTMVLSIEMVTIQTDTYNHYICHGF